MPFQPGVSGNPNGRPPGSGSVEKAFTQALNIAVKEAHAAGGDKLRAVADALVDKAMTGDVPAIKELADRIEGKVTVDAHITGNVTYTVVSGVPRDS